MKTPDRMIAITVILLVPALASAQTVQTTAVNATSSLSNTNGCGSDKLQLTGFTMSPSAPAANQTATVTLTVKNLCTGTSLNVPYKVTNQAVNVASGTKSVSANSSATVQIPLTFAAGSHALDAMLDAANTLNEPVSTRTNNNASAGILFNVAAPRITLIMHPEMAPASVGLAPKIKVSNHNCGPAAQLSDLMSKVLLSWGTIPAPPAPYAPMPYPIEIGFGSFICKVQAEVEVYAAQLQNGWQVKSVSAQASGSGGTWSWAARPSAGSTNATTKLLITTFPGTPTLRVKLNVEIEGPQGTNPFQ